MTKRIRTHTNPFTLQEALPQLDFEATFQGFSGVLDFEIGFGRGVFLRSYAARYRERHILAADVRKSLIPMMTERLDKDSISNVHILHGTGERCIDELIPDRSLARVFIFHPDPWFKKKHHKRRVVKPAFLSALAPKMAKNGRLYISTDVPELWEAMMDSISESLFDAVKDDAFWQNDYRTHWGLFSEEDERSQLYGAFSCEAKT